MSRPGTEYLLQNLLKLPDDLVGVHTRNCKLKGPGAAHNLGLVIRKLFSVGNAKVLSAVFAPANLPMNVLSLALLVIEHLRRSKIMKMKLASASLGISHSARPNPRESE